VAVVYLGPSFASLPSCINGESQKCHDTQQRKTGCRVAPTHGQACICHGPGSGVIPGEGQHPCTFSKCKAGGREEMGMVRKSNCQQLTAILDARLYERNVHRSWPDLHYVP